VIDQSPPAVEESRARPRLGTGLLGQRLRVERRVEPGPTALYRVVAIVIALAVAAVYIWVSVPAESDPFGSIWEGTFGAGISTVLSAAAPLLFTGLAVAIPYRMGLWNIGGEGQLFIGAWAAAAVAFALPNLSGALLIPLMLCAAALGGALWILVPALARAHLGVSEIITTLLLNFVAIFWMTYWVTGPWQEVATAGGIQSRALPEQSSLSLVTVGSAVFSWGLLLGVALALILWLVFRGTVLGFEVSVLGSSLRAGRYAGMSTARRLVTVMLIGGAMGGLAGAVSMMGDLHRYTDTLSTQTGYSGIVVAVLAAGFMPAVPIMAVLLAALTASGNTLQILGESSDTSFALMGLILLLAAMGDGLARYRVTYVRRPEEPA
jgi:simple sugar transport system permease protein